MKQYAVYIAVAVFSAMIGATVSHFYSRDTINALQIEIDQERLLSKRKESEMNIQIDSLNSVTHLLDSLNDKTLREIVFERNRRAKFIDTVRQIQIINDTDSLINELRKIYN